MSREVRRGLPGIAARPEPIVTGPRVAQIVSAARTIVDEQGATALTMRRLGDDLGIKAPSLYKHLPGRSAVIARIVDDVFFEAGDVFHAAVSRRSTAGPVAALLRAYRRFGREHPNLYRLTTDGDLPRDELTPGLEQWAGEPFFRATGEPHRAQALWAFAHGMLTLEIDDRFLPGSPLDATWLAGVDAFDR